MNSLLDSSSSSSSSYILSITATDGATLIFLKVLTYSHVNTQPIQLNIPTAIDWQHPRGSDIDPLPSLLRLTPDEYSAFTE